MRSICNISPRSNWVVLCSDAFFGFPPAFTNLPHTPLCHNRNLGTTPIPWHPKGQTIPTKAPVLEQQPQAKLSPVYTENAAENRTYLPMHHSVLTRFYEYLPSPPSDIQEALQIWNDLMQTSDDPASRWIVLASISHSHLRRFGERIIQQSCASLKKSPSHPVEIADTLDAILAEIQKRACKPSKTDTYMQWHAKILRREFSFVARAIGLETSEAAKTDHKLARTMTELFLNCYFNDGLAAAIDILLPFSNLMTIHIDGDKSHFDDPKVKFESWRLRESVFNAFSTTPDPLAWITTAPNSKTAQEFAMYIFFHLYGRRGDADRSWRLFEYLQARKIVVPFSLHLYLLDIFIKQRAFQCAESINISLRENFKELVTDPEKRVHDELFRNLHLASLQGDFQKSQEIYDLLVARGFPIDRGTRLRLMHAYSVGRIPERVEELFAEFYLPCTKMRPTLREYREVIYAHVRAKNLSAVNHWLAKMINANINPDLSVYNMILLGLSHELDIEAAVSLLSRMYESNIQPDVYSFTTVLSIYAQKKDPLGAEKVYERAIKEGIEPDEVMTMALMNAHIEAGSWRGAIRVFDYLNLGRISNSRYLGHLYNTLLKAYVLIGAPFNVIFKIFRRFDKLRLIPTLRTYTLLIQSACDSGRMDIARDLFLELDAQPTYGRLKSHVDAYLMTVLMAGFLRIGDRDRAKLVYEDMLSRDLRPGAVTFGIIIRSFAERGTAENLKMAEDFMDGLLGVDESQKAWLNTLRGGPHKALENLFTPLMSIYGRDLNVDSVQRLYDYMISAGGDATITSLNILMDAYRRTRNLEAVQEIWREIVEIARRLTQKDLLDRLPAFGQHMKFARPIERTPDIPSYQANLLCISLSIYIEALSSAGKHLEIAKVWKEVRDWGYAFDAHNWNHLAIALVRAGEVERAFEIVERVLLPHQKEVGDIVRERKKQPSSPFFFVKGPVLNSNEMDDNNADKTTTDLSSHSPSDTKPSEIEEDGDEDRQQQPVGSVLKSRRIEAVKLSTAQQRTFELTDLDVESPDMDAAQPLYELQQISAHFQGWRVHNRTLHALRMALNKLGDGKLVKATREPGGFMDNEEVTDISEMRIQEKLENYQFGIDREEAEKMVAAEIRGRIMTQYPRSVIRINQFVEKRELQQWRSGRRG